MKWLYLWIAIDVVMLLSWVGCLAAVVRERDRRVSTFVLVVAGLFGVAGVAVVGIVAAIVRLP